jgi:RHS repeat-associated protein
LDRSSGEGRCVELDGGFRVKEGRLRLIAAAMIAPMLYLGTGVTEQLWAAAQRPAAPESVPDSLPARFAGYTIDTDGIRWLKTVGVSVTTYLVDRVQPFQQVLEDRVGGSVTATYVHLDDLVAAAFPGTGTRFYHYDGQMSTRKLTDPLAVVTDEYTFDAWGVTLASTGSTPNNYLYTGEQFDPNVAMQYNRARYLSLTIARFLSQDALLGSETDPSSLHRYLYAHGDPIRGIDPSGLYTLLELIVIVVIFIVVIGLALAAFLTAGHNELESDEVKFIEQALPILDRFHNADVGTFNASGRIKSKMPWYEPGWASSTPRDIIAGYDTSHGRLVFTSGFFTLGPYAAAVVLFGEAQHVGGAHDDKAAQNELDDFKERFLVEMYRENPKNQDTEERDILGFAHKGQKPRTIDTDALKKKAKEPRSQSPMGP